MIPNSVKFPIPCEYAFRYGLLALSISPVMDFEKRGQRDNQARDENGVPLWLLRAMDMDPQAGMFGRSTEVKVKIASEEEPELPESEIPGYPPSVELTGLMVTPYPDRNPCKGTSKPHQCRARLAWSLRATGIRAAVRATEKVA